MHRIAAFVLAATFAAVTCLSSASAEDVQDQLKKMETDRAAAVVKGDVEVLEKSTADDYSLINVNGQMSDKSRKISGIKSGQTKLTSNNLSDLNVRVYGDTAVITGKADVKGMVGGKDATGQILFTRVYVKKDRRWQSVAFQQTRVSTP